MNFFLPHACTIYNMNLYFRLQIPNSKKCLFTGRSILRNSIDTHQFKRRGITTKIWLQDMRFFLRKKILLLKAFMTTPRRIQIGSGVELVKFNSSYSWFPCAGSRVVPVSFSEMAGHGSFFFLAVSYLESEFLYLRLYAVSGFNVSLLSVMYKINLPGNRNLPFHHLSVLPWKTTLDSYKMECFIPLDQFCHDSIFAKGNMSFWSDSLAYYLMLNRSKKMPTAPLKSRSNSSQQYLSRKAWNL